MKEPLVRQAKSKSLVVKFPQTDKKDLTFPNDVVFPHSFIKEITDKLFDNEKIMVKKVYEGTIPDNFFLIFPFFY